MVKPSRDLFRVTLLGTGAPPRDWIASDPARSSKLETKSSSSMPAGAPCSESTSWGFLSAILRDCFLRTTIPTTSWAFPISLANGMDRPALGQTEPATACLGPGRNQTNDGAFAAGFRRRYSGAEQKLPT